MKNDYSTMEDMIFAATAKFNGGVLDNEDVASKFGELILRNTLSLEIVQRQLPLKVTDQGDTWLISGAPEISADKPGPWQMTVNKLDARVRMIKDYSDRVLQSL